MNTVVLNLNSVNLTEEQFYNDLRLGWLINPQEQRVEIYRPSQPVEILALPALLSGEDVLPGFTLYLGIFD